MGYKVIFAPQAIERLEEIVRYIAQDNPSIAKKFGLSLIDRTSLLSDFPELGQPYSKRSGVRRLIVKPYIIFYRVRYESQTFEVLRFWHGARRQPVL